MSIRNTQSGYTLIELVISMTIAAMLLTGLQQLLGTGLATKELAEEKADLARQGRFAMARMVDAVRGGERLLIPLADNPATTYAENVRSETVPASTPQTGSSLDTAVLAVTLRTDQDMDANGIFDADNDGDGHFDEDLPADTDNDGEPGIRDFDDDGDGVVSLSPPGDDDESNDLAQSDDPVNGLDDDGDGSVDEDPGADNNDDAAPGIVGVDDDNDGSIDEGDVADDDEDGLIDEDWYDPVVFYLNGSTLVERRAVPWDENSDSTIDGQDYVESDIADDITLLQFERIAVAPGQPQLVEITLILGTGNSISLNTRVRVGAIHE